MQLSVQKVQKLINGPIGFIFGAIIFCFCFSYVLYTLFFNNVTHADFSIFTQYDAYSLTGLIFIILLLSVANLAVETLKWNNFVLQVEQTSFKKSMISVTHGFAVGFITPYRIGDYPGRTILFESKNRVRLMLYNLLSGYAQFIVICLMALISIVFLPVDFDLYFNHYSSMKFVYVFLFTALIFWHLFFLFCTDSVLRFLSNHKKLSIFKRHFNAPVQLSFLNNLYVLHLSILRTVIYTVQLYLIFRFFDRSVNSYELILYINLYFFILTIAPSFLLNKFGIRESISIVVFSPVIHNPVTIVVSVLFLWSINQLLPAVFGAVHLIFCKKS